MRLNTSTLRGLPALCLLTGMLPLGPCAAQGAPGFRPGTPDRVCLAMRARAQQVGQPAADIRGVDQNGAAMDLAQLKGKVILLDVSAMWCVWCQVDAPALEKLSQTYGPKGLAVVTCLTEDSNGAGVTPAGLKQWAATYHLTTPVMNDASGTSNGVAESAYVSLSGGFPTLVLIDKSFNVQYLAGGLDLPAVTAKLQALLAQ